jgi:hypothetical protein
MGRWFKIKINVQKLKARQFPTRYLKNGIYKHTQEWERATDHDRKSGKVRKYYIDVEGKRVFVGPSESGQEWGRISGQDIYKGIPSHNRSEMVYYLKDFYRPLVREQLQPVKKYPLFIEFKMYTTVDSVWDPSNMWIYGKVFEDVLVDEGIIEDDKNDCISYPPVAPLIIPVQKWESRRLEFHIKQDKREISKQFKNQ